MRSTHSAMLSPSPASPSRPSASSRMSSPVGVASVTTAFSRSVSIRLRIAKSISAAPETTTLKAESGMSTSAPLASSSSSRMISSTKLSMARPSADRRESGGAVVADLQDRVEAAHPEYLAHIGYEAEQRELAVQQQHAQSGAADVVEPAHVDRQVRLAAAEGGGQLLLRRFCRTAVEPSARLEDEDGTVALLEDLHGAPLAAALTPPLR